MCKTLNLCAEFYFMCKAGPDNSLKYSKQIISPTGEILGTREFKIKPTVKPINGTDTLYGEFHLQIKMSFEIVEPNFVSCHWVTDDGKVIE